MEREFKTDEEKLERKRENYRRWREAHAEEQRARCREYYYANKEKERTRNRDYCNENKEKRSSNWKKYYSENSERLKEAARLRRAGKSAEVSDYNRRYYAENIERESKRSAAWRLANIERVRETTKKYLRERRASDPSFKMLTTLRNRIVSVLKRGKGQRADRTIKMLGCSIDEFRLHLESKFLPGMTWKNHGSWHIDHIIPCAAFDMADPAQQRACFNWSNLQPLWAADNIRKGAKVG